MYRATLRHLIRMLPLFSALPEDVAPYVKKLNVVLQSRWCFNQPISKVMDHLYLGGESEATNIELLTEIGITHVINCAAGYMSTGSEFYGDMLKSYVGFDAEDDEDYDILQHFDDVFEAIEDARGSGGKALIHCLAGVNRSGALTVAYIMKHKNCGPITAVRHVIKERKHILSNEDFRVQLVRFAQRNNLLQLDESEIKKKKAK